MNSFNESTIRTVNVDDEQINPKEKLQSNSDHHQATEINKQM